MKFSHEAGAPDEYLGDMLDALESGLILLRRERDELRDQLVRISQQLGKQRKTRAQKTKISRDSRAAQARSRKSKSPGKSKLKEEETEHQNAPRKTRIALGRTLNQLRAIRSAGLSPSESSDARPTRAASPPLP
jgi:hypothetical protein